MKILIFVSFLDWELKKMAEAEASVIEQTDTPADAKMEIETKKVF